MQAQLSSRVHISIEVSDLAASIAFYEKLFQHPPTRVKPDYANFRLESPALHLALNLVPDRLPEPVSGGTVRHFGIELFEDVRLSNWLKTVQTEALVPRIEEQITCCYAVADKFWVRDPDGHEWEFWVRKEDVDTARDEQLEDAACCAPTTTGTSACSSPASEEASSGSTAAPKEAAPKEAAQQAEQQVLSAAPARCCPAPVDSVATPLESGIATPGGPCCTPKADTKLTQIRLG